MTIYDSRCRFLSGLYLCFIVYPGRVVVSLLLLLCFLGVIFIYVVGMYLALIVCIYEYLKRRYFNEKD